MYTLLLTEDERKLFDYIVGVEPLKGATILLGTGLKDIIDDVSTNHGDGTLVTLNERTLFYKDTDARINPTISSWLDGISAGKDGLSGKQGNVSDAIAGKDVETTAGTKSFGRALFEKRVGIGSPKAVDWVDYAEARFKDALTRSEDTPNDPSTENIDESSRTSIKLK